jgi:hypothetical protein
MLATPLLFTALWSMAGCSGSAIVQFVSLHPSEIDPPHAAVWRLDAQQCYWWIDQNGELNVAMRCQRRDLLAGRFGRVDLDMSFVLGDSPAGSGRNYAIHQREMRSLFVSALQTQRLIAQQGIVGVTIRDDRTIRGSFRVWITPQVQLQVPLFLPQQSGPILCFGTFRAVEEAARGKEIRLRCEADGWSRPPRRPTPPTTSAAASQSAYEKPKTEPRP